MSSSWMRSLFVPSLLEKLRFVATQEQQPLFAGDATLLLGKQTQSRKHAFVVDVYVKERLLWLSDGIVTVNSIITEEAAQLLEQDSEYISVAQLRLGEIILRKFDCILEYFQNNWKPRIVIHQFYYKGEVVASLDSSLKLECDPKVGHLLGTFSKVVSGVDNYKREAVFLLSGLWKEAFDSSRISMRFATSSDILKLSKFVETDNDQLDSREENNIPSFIASYDEVEQEIDTTAPTTIKQESHEQNVGEILSTTSGPNEYGSDTNPQPVAQEYFPSESNNVSTENAKDQPIDDSWPQNAAKEYVDIPNDSSLLFPSRTRCCTECLKRRKAVQTFSACPIEVDIAPVEDILSRQHDSQPRLQMVHVFSMHIDGSNEPVPRTQRYKQGNEMKEPKKIYSIEELLEERKKWFHCSSIYSLITPKKRKALQDS